VEFNIFGPIEDPQYWRECEQLSRTLPPNIQVSYKGAIPPERVVSTMREHHLFLFPTMNENFGHVIAEAFAGGCTVLVSDQTPWRNLEEKGVGWDLPLDRLDLFRDAVSECAQLDQAEFDARAARARLMVQDCADVDDLRGRYRQMFLDAARTPGSKDA
jgi:glycosyltransferase involved in cell wall biosynthesis